MMVEQMLIIQDFFHKFKFYRHFWRDLILTLGGLNIGMWMHNVTIINPSLVLWLKEWNWRSMNVILLVVEKGIWMIG